MDSNLRRVIKTPQEKHNRSNSQGSVRTLTGRHTTIVTSDEVFSNDRSSVLSFPYTTVNCGSGCDLHQSEKAGNKDHYDHETNEVENSAHVSSSFLLDCSQVVSDAPLDRKKAAEKRPIAAQCKA